MKLNLSLIILYFVIFFTSRIQAQQVQPRWEVGAGIGLSGYLGDLNKSDFFSKEPKFSGGLFGRYHLNRNWALRGGLTFGQLSGNDANFDDRRVRGFKTRSPLTDLSAIVEYDFLGKKRFKYDSTAFQVKFKRQLSPYLFTGMGLGFTNPKPDFTGTPNTPANFRQGAIADLATNYSKTNFVIPFGIGVRYDLTPNWVLGAEAGFRLAFTDYLDGVSQGANPGRDDRYKLSSISVAYRFDKKDTDRDGISDEKDACPNEPGSVRMKGCPDRDGDGIADKDDACPDVAGLARFKGCPDRDGDGIPDKDDACPDVAGLPQFNGCPDRDGDGIPDKDDACPNVAGLAQFKGCPDRDGDGIADKDDACPDVAGVAQFNGCPDRDGDGVEDAKDLCPDVAGKPEFEGCPDAKTLTKIKKEAERKAKIEAEAAKKQPVKINETQKTVDLSLDRVLFAPNSAELQNEYLPVLDKAAELLNQNTIYIVRLIGHTDDKGAASYNQILSVKRAKACLDYLVGKGIAPSRIKAIGLGERKPTATNQTEEGRQQNRRVEVQVKQ
ncbi:MAG: DUF6089 family protein [Runella sp.]